MPSTKLAPPKPTYKCWTQFSTQLKVVMWKNATLKIRSWWKLVIEISIPVLFMLVLIALRSSIHSTTEEESIPSSVMVNPSFSSQFQTPPCRGENLLWRCYFETSSSQKSCSNGLSCVAKKIAITSSNVIAESIAKDFTVYADSSINTIKYNHSTTLPTFVRYFDSENSFVSYVETDGYSQDSKMDVISAAVVFNSGPPNWDYTIRMNTSFTDRDIQAKYNQGKLPRTDSVSIDSTLLYNSQTPGNSSWAPYVEEYQETGYFALADLVNSFIASTQCNQSSLCSGISDVEISTQGVVHFPSKEVEVQEFWSLIGFIFGLFLILALLYPVANVISELVTEKETKIREGMSMMALRDDVLWFSWWLHWFFLFLPLAILITIVSQSLFTYSNKFLVFMWFFLFFLASISYSFAISTLFNTARTASIFGALFYFAGFFIQLALTNSDPDRNSYLLASLHPSAAFVLGSQAFIEYEDSQIGVNFNTAGSSELYPITFADTLGMLVADALYLLVLAWYLAHVMPSQYGTVKPWYFILDYRYWFESRHKYHKNKHNKEPIVNALWSKADKKQVEKQDVDDCPVEPVADNIASQILNNECVDIRGLRKEFRTNTGTKVAVDGLNLTMYSGQITALLGHNGAGKSTAIAMLTGLLPSDGGEAIVEGLSMSDNMQAIRSIIGVCPQHDILFPNLTVEEHLRMFAAFKGVPREEIPAEVEKMIQSVGLTEKRKAYSRTLSGGQKRKLSVGIAFIGNSRVVFLDEPTSGMDPYSRRFTWNVIRQHREGRVVVLTTHFMDEADLLGDRIAIMGDGKLRCCGSSLFLKQRFGVGYNMTLEKLDPNDFDTNRLNSLVHSTIPEAKLLTDVGTEISYQLPFNGSSKFQALFESFDENLDQLGLRSYGMSVTTLEEVFLKVAEGTTTLATAAKGKYGDGDDAASAPAGDIVGFGKERTVAGVRVDDVDPDDEKKDDHHTREIGTVGSSKKSGKHSMKTRLLDADENMDEESRQAFASVPFEKISDDKAWDMFKVHMEAMLKKRFLYFKRDVKAWGCQIFAPVVFILVGVLVQQLVTKTTLQPELVLKASIYNKDVKNNKLPLPFSNNSVFLSTTSGDAMNFVEVEGVNFSVSRQGYIMNKFQTDQILPIIGLSNVGRVSQMSKYLLDTRENFEASKFGAYDFINLDFDSASGALTKLYYYLHSNYTAPHAGPIFQRELMNSVVKTYDSSASVTVRLHPMPLSSEEKKSVTENGVFFMVCFILIALPFTPAAFVTFVVREREIKSKYQQVVSGVSVWAYWLATWIWDNVSFQITLWLIVIIIGSTPNLDAIGATDTQALGVTIGLLILYGFAITPFTYLSSFFFKQAAGAQIAILFMNLLIGLGLSIVGVFMRLIDSTAGVYKGLRYIFALFPPFALGDGLFCLAYSDTFSSMELGYGEKYALNSMELAGTDIVFLFWTSIVYMGLTIMVEYGFQLPSIQALGNFRRAPKDDTVRDEDVIAEEQRVAAGEVGDATIVIDNIKKVYPGGKYAVRGVSLAIPNGECFGLLGINGAGKSTTLSMLTGEIAPTSGNMHLSGVNLLTEIHKCRRYIGYCPQFDALFELLTGREHLTLYAAIKGIVKKDIPAVVNAKIAEMGLTEYADRAAGSYSGGNKRKLSVAMAMIGEPTIVFLDEPSTGMDPVARRFMWDVISDIVTKREKCSLILTTHSMEECEALCTRIGIMVGGVLRCLGSGQRLRSRYGLGYQVEIGLKLPDATEVEAKLQVLTQLAPTLVQQRSRGRSLSATFSNTQVDDELTFDMATIHRLFKGLHRELWLERLNEHGSGAELFASLQSMQKVSGRQVASWVILEEACDAVFKFLLENFPGYQLRERQTAKIRVEIPSQFSDGSVLRLSKIFGMMESNKDVLHIQEYSVGQTSLEQIFNTFASQQLEEQGRVIG